MIDLSSLTGDYTASAGDVLTNATEYVVTVPAGATVTINGVTVTGGEAASEPPTFADGGAAITSGIVQGAGNTWTLSAFAELANGSAAGLADAQVRIYASDTPAGLDTAEPMSTGVTVVEKVPAMKVTLAVDATVAADSQFFRVEFKDSGSELQTDPQPQPEPGPQPQPDPQPEPEPEIIDPAITAFITHCYRATLNREPVGSEMEKWGGELMRNKRRGKQVARAIVLSADVAAMNLNNGDFVTMLYKLFMNRNATDVELQGWVTRMETGEPRESVVESFVNSGEFTSFLSSFGL